MKARKRMIVTTTCALALMVNGLSVFAQQSESRAARKVRPAQAEQAAQEFFVEGPQVVVAAQPEGGVAQSVVVDGPADGPNTFVFVSSEISFAGLVKGAPYSAQAVTESIQVLADGNRIVRKTTAQVYRDSEGRTRRDQTIGAIGPYALAGDPPQTFFINDPVAGVNYILEPRTRIARKMAAAPHPFVMKKIEDETGAKRAQAVVTVSPEERQRIELRAKGGEAKAKEEVAVFEHKIRPAGPGTRSPVNREGGDIIVEGSVMAGPISYERLHFKPENMKKESLGKQTIEGVEVEGTRVTTVIPAGQIGNEQPINIINERWYSPELQTVIMSKHSDPRAGETIYRLTGINRAEPDASLFQVPSDYTIKEAGPARARVRPRNPEDEK